ncbi:MAG: hypothetical protein B7C55_13345, partial [Actinomycetales bacterium mxb001]
MAEDSAREPVTRQRHGLAESLEAASLRIPFRVKVALVWAVIFALLGFAFLRSGFDIPWMIDKAPAIVRGVWVTILFSVIAITLAIGIAGGREGGEEYLGRFFLAGVLRADSHNRPFGLVAFAARRRLEQAGHHAGHLIDAAEFAEGPHRRRANRAVGIASGLDQRGERRTGATVGEDLD